MAASLPVVFASNQSAVLVSGTVAISGTVPVSIAASVAVTIASMPTTPTKPDGTVWTLTGTSANVNITNASLAVTGTFWQATQPISAVSLPLPANAAQETGGNLATLVTRTPIMGQAVAAASSPVVVASDQAAIPVASNPILELLTQILVELQAQSYMLTQGFSLRDDQDQIRDYIASDDPPTFN
jgi:hypothetical protein